METQKYADSIQLPDTELVFRNIRNAKRFAIDIGKHLFDVTQWYKWVQWYDGRVLYYIIAIIPYIIENVMFPYTLLNFENLSLWFSAADKSFQIYLFVC